MEVHLEKFSCEINDDDFGKLVFAKEISFWIF